MATPHFYTNLPCFALSPFFSKNFWTPPPPPISICHQFLKKSNSPFMMDRGVEIWSYSTGVTNLFLVSCSYDECERSCLKAQLIKTFQVLVKNISDPYKFSAVWTLSALVENTAMKTYLEEGPVPTTNNNRFFLPFY